MDKYLFVKYAGGRLFWLQTCSQPVTRHHGNDVGVVAPCQPLASRQHYVTILLLFTVDNR